MFKKHELQNIISGTGYFAKGTFIQAVTNYLRECKKTGSISQEVELIKEQEAKALIAFASENSILHSTFHSTRFIAEGAEQKVYLDEDGVNVVKLNDAIFYRNWEDYLHSLLLHNYFFPSTYYQLNGFLIYNDILYAMVKQPYVYATEETNVEIIRELMFMNGFDNIKNEDYYNPDLGIILEDLHDENVIINQGIPFFIYTVFYLTKEFYLVD